MMTPREIAHASGMGLLAIYAFIREGLIGSVRVGRSIYVPRREYERWLNQFDRAGNAA
jgi:excisionase family DNA binding protein